MWLHSGLVEKGWGAEGRGNGKVDSEGGGWDSQWGEIGGPEGVCGELGRGGEGGVTVE